MRVLFLFLFYIIPNYFNVNFDNLFNPSSIWSSGIVKESLIYPSPAVPYPLPGVTTTFTSSSSFSVNEADVWPSGGNDYIAIDGREKSYDWNQLSLDMSRPGFGVGSDGIVVVFDSDQADIRMRVYNPDGSEAEISGNGIRLFTKFVIDQGIVSP